MNHSSDKPQRLLHIFCGDCAADVLRQSAVQGDILVWHDPVLEGPLLPKISTPEYLDMRARHFVEQQYIRTYEEALQGLKARHQQLESAGQYDEVVLWFDACLFDQSIMVQLITRLSEIDAGTARISLICIGEHPDIDRFVGLGQLNPRQMAERFPDRHELTTSEKTLASTAWKALTSRNPHEIEHVVSGDCTPLPYLKDALRRRLEMYPSTFNGLSRLEHELLQVLNEEITSPPDIFKAISALEARPWFGDIMVWERVDGLAADTLSLVKVKGGRPLKKPLWDQPQGLSKEHVRITDTGREVLAGDRDRLTLSGVDTWLGGVHLRGRNPEWRWDPFAKKLVRSPRAATG